ncbi:MAG TPA: ABATE domain-containing protein [Candidatus Sulfotelmatobacter sp.]|nr:ABATE domain-containing protein [Candidatus Sulfotelmatobacter sp.]
MGNITTDKPIAKRRPPRFELIAGALCLDFINTLDDRFSKEPKELLKHYVDLARFAEDTGILDGAQVDRLMERGYASAGAAQRALAAAVELREAMCAVFFAIVNKKTVPQAALITLNQYLQGAAQHSRLVPVNGRFQWRFDAVPNNFEAPLWPIARSAADLLASEQLGYVRACASQTCLWLFLDESKNHRRRWCDMTKCGNRAKFQRFYSRKKKASA